MLGFAWVTMRQAQDALKQGRLEEARRLLQQPAALGQKKASELLVQVARAFVERGERFLRLQDPAAAWTDLLAAEQIGAKDAALLRLRQALGRQGVAEARALLEAGEPNRALDVVAQIRGRGVQVPELYPLEEAGRAWVLAREQAGRGEFAQALQTLERVRGLVPVKVDALEKVVALLEQRYQAFSDMLVNLHEAATRKDWREVVRISEQVLAMAPQHLEARKARARAWQAIDPQTVSSPVKAQEKVEESAHKVEPSPRFLLWIDGVGGFLVCLGNRVTVGQATAEANVEIPLYADVSRIHATLIRESEGYLVEALRPVQVNGKRVERAPLQSGDRITLGDSCQVRFQLPVPVSASARLDVVSGHRLPLTVDGILLMADTLVLGPGPQAHVEMPDLAKPIILFRQKDGLGVRYAGELTVDGQRCRDRGQLGPNSTVTGDDFAFAVEPVGTGTGRM